MPRAVIQDLSSEDFSHSSDSDAPIIKNTRKVASTAKKPLKKGSKFANDSSTDDLSSSSASRESSSEDNDSSDAEISKKSKKALVGNKANTKQKRQSTVIVTNQKINKKQAALQDLDKIISAIKEDDEDDDDDGLVAQRLHDFQQSTELMIRLNSIGKLNSQDVWAWGDFTSHIHKFILTKIQAGENVDNLNANGNIVDDFINFSEKAAIIDATTSIYTQRLQDLYQTLAKSVEYSLKTSAAVGALDDNKKEVEEEGKKNTKDKKQREKLFAPTVEDPSHHNLTQCDSITPYDITFNSITTGLASNVGIKTLLSYNSQLQANYINTICSSLDNNPYNILPDASSFEIENLRSQLEQIQLQNEDFYVSQQRLRDPSYHPDPVTNPIDHSKIDTSMYYDTGDSVYDAASNKTRIQLQQRLQRDIAKFDADSALKKDAISRRIDCIIDNTRYTIYNAINLENNGNLPKTVIDQIKYVKRAKDNNEDSYILPPLYIPIDNGLHMFIDDCKQKEKNFTALLRQKHQKENPSDSLSSSNPLITLEMMLSTPQLDNDDLAKAALSVSHLGSSNAGASSAIGGATTTATSTIKINKKDFDLELLKENAYTTLHSLLPSASEEKLLRSSNIFVAQHNEHTHGSMDDEDHDDIIMLDSDDENTTIRDRKLKAKNPSKLGQIYTNFADANNGENILVLYAPHNPGPLHFQREQLLSILSQYKRSQLARTSSLSLLTSSRARGTKAAAALAAQAADNASSVYRINKALLLPFLHSNIDITKTMNKILAGPFITRIIGEESEEKPQNASKRYKQTTKQETQANPAIAGNLLRLIDPSIIDPSSVPANNQNSSISKKSAATSIIHLLTADSLDIGPIPPQLIPVHIQNIENSTTNDLYDISNLKKRNNIFDFSRMADGKMHTLFPSTGTVGDEDAYYLNQRDKLKQTRHSLSFNDNLDDGDYSTLDANDMMELGSNSVVQLGNDGFMVDSPQKQQDVQLQVIDIQFTQEDSSAFYNVEDMQSVMAQHAQYRLEEQIYDEKFQNNEKTVVSHQTSSHPTVYMKKNIEVSDNMGDNDDINVDYSGNFNITDENGEQLIDSNDFDNTQNNDNKATYTIHSTHTPPLSRPVVSALASAIDGLLFNQQMNKQNHLVATFLSKNDNDDESDESDVEQSDEDDDVINLISDNDEMNDHMQLSYAEKKELKKQQRREKKAAMHRQTQKPLTGMQLNLLRRQNNLHRMFQKLLSEEPQVKKGGKKSKKSNIDDASDSDPLQEVKEDDKKKKTGKKKKITSFDVEAIIRADGIPATCGMTTYLSIAPGISARKYQKRGTTKAKLSPDEIKKITAVTRPADGLLHNVQFPTIMSTLDEHIYAEHTLLLNESDKKIPKKEEQFIKYSQMIFSPDHTVEDELFDTLVRKPSREAAREQLDALLQADESDNDESGKKKLKKSTSVFSSKTAVPSSTTTNTSIVSAMSNAQKNLLPRYVATQTTFLSSLMTLQTRPDVILPITAPMNSYIQQTNFLPPPVHHIDSETADGSTKLIDYHQQYRQNARRTIVNVLLSKAIVGDSIQSLSHKYQKNALLKQKQEKELQKQQLIQKMVSAAAIVSSEPLQQHNLIDHDHDGNDDDNKLFGDDFYKPTGNDNDSGSSDGSNLLFGLNDAQMALLHEDNGDFNGDSFDNNPSLDENSTDTSKNNDKPLDYIDFNELNRILEKQQAEMFQKDLEVDSFLQQLQRGVDKEYGTAGSLDDDNNVLNLHSLMSKTGDGTDVSSAPTAFDPFGIMAAMNSHTQNNPFAISLDDNSSNNDVLKYSTVSKYFNMRQLKHRLLVKVTKPSLKRVLMSNLKTLRTQLQNNKRDEKQRRNQFIDTTLPDLPREAYDVTHDIEQLAGTQSLYLNINEIKSTAQPHQVNPYQKSIKQIQQLNGGIPTGECYATSFQDVVSQVQSDYSDFDVRSISTFFLSLLILSNETGLELRPRVDSSIHNIHNDDEGDANKKKHQEQHPNPNVDPLSIGYTFSDFDIYIPLNTKQVKSVQIQHQKAQSNPSPIDTISNTMVDEMPVKVVDQPVVEERTLTQTVINNTPIKTIHNNNHNEMGDIPAIPATPAVTFNGLARNPSIRRSLAPHSPHSSTPASAHQNVTVSNVNGNKPTTKGHVNPSAAKVSSKIIYDSGDDDDTLNLDSD